jgi:Tfp pilus assembly protein PilO
MQIRQIFSGKRQAIDKAKSTVFVTMVVAAIIVSFSLVTINFLWDLRGYNQRVISEKERARDTLQQNVENAKTLQENFALLEQGDVTSQDVLDALPSKYDFAALVTSIDSLAKRSGMVLDSFSGDDLSAEAVQSATQPEPVAMPFIISVQGSYEDLQRFLETLDRSIRPIRVEAVEISGTDDLINADITLSTFYQPQASLEAETKVVQ